MIRSCDSSLAHGEQNPEVQSSCRCSKFSFYSCPELFDHGVPLPGSSRPPLQQQTHLRQTGEALSMCIGVDSGQSETKSTKKIWHLSSKRGWMMEIFIIISSYALVSTCLQGPHITYAGSRYDESVFSSRKIYHKERFTGGVSCGLGFLCSGNNRLATKLKTCYSPVIFPYLFLGCGGICCFLLYEMLSTLRSFL